MSVNQQYVAHGKARVEHGNLLAGGGGFVPETEAPAPRREYPKWVNGVQVVDANEERLVLDSDDDAETLRVRLAVRRQQRVSEQREAQVARTAERQAYPKFVMRPDGRPTIVHSAAEEQAMTLGSTGPAIPYHPSPAAREALAAAVADGVGDESTIIDKAILAWAKWRGSAMKPGQRPPRKKGTAANDGAPAEAAPVA